MSLQSWKEVKGWKFNINKLKTDQQTLVINTLSSLDVEFIISPDADRLLWLVYKVSLEQQQQFIAALQNAQIHGIDRVAMASDQEIEELFPTHPESSEARKHTSRARD
jgi:hypothetical protein